MRIAVIDLDNSGFPNLALMKISAWHKAGGDDVQLNILMGADKVYASCVFSWNKKEVCKLPQNAIIGGAAISPDKLPDEIEHIKPDYDLYNKAWSMGFTSRGCYRSCEWCIVPKKEGTIQVWANIYEFWDPTHKRLKLLDNNLLAATNALETLEILAIEQLEVDFCQGLDIRCITDENAKLLAKIKPWGALRFAYDRVEDESAVRSGIEILFKNGIASTRLMFYTLFGAGDTPQDNLHRLSVLNEYRVAIYPMFFVPLDARNKTRMDHPQIEKNNLIYPEVRGPRSSFQKMMRRLKGG